MPRYCRVLPDPGRALSQLFTYRVPPRLEARVQLGSQVLVPFGQRLLVGLVLEFHEQPDRPQLREVEAVLEGAPPLPADAWALASWLAEYYLCDLSEAIRPFLPGGLTYRVTRRFRLTHTALPPTLFADSDLEQLCRALRAGGELPLAALQRVLPQPRLSRALRTLRSDGVVEERALVMPPAASTKRVRLVALLASSDEVTRYVEAHGRRARARVACLRAAQSAGPLPPSELAHQAGVSVSVVQALVMQGMLTSQWGVVRRVPWRGEAAVPSVPVLNPEQQAAADAIRRAVAARQAVSFLLYGVTASGKTEVFLRAIAEAMAHGLQSIVLMPEISLTAQAIGIFRSRFGDRVAILHSALSAGERWDEAERIRRGEAAVVIGARSALFAPVRALGLIVIDEEHEATYKQEQAPRYHARDTALKRAELNGCPVVLASATPAVESFHRALAGHHQLLRLPTRVEARPLPSVRVVDLRGAGRSPAIFSGPLRQGLAARLQTEQQVILFLNRRGYATFLVCPSCGHALRCRDCGIALTYYRQERSLRCHHCGLSRHAPSACPGCGGPEISFSGFGTERVAGDLAQLFPQARIDRLDRDTTSAKDAHIRILQRFREGETDVLVGTQMVAKGLDFPRVTLVGVITADTALNLPDFRAGERTFQLLTQVAGRSGRGQAPGEVIVQTYRPDHYAVRAAAHQDYDQFYEQEILMREELHYPPFRQLARVVLASTDAAEAERQAGLLAARLRQAAPRGLDVLGPAPAPLARLRGRFRWHLLVRGPQGLPGTLLRGILADASGWRAGTVSVDVDPVSLL